MKAQKTVRCAIYTRKSSEEGLDQDFNSLHAQRESCAAYIQSQCHEGWQLLPTAYDDGGYSGGTLERPALRQLLADIDAGAVDLIVVYKIDRLTRALNDFAKIVERLDARSASFVSVTQSFNTTTSMGRLTLNVLLSFAQFEREVTGERIRDKIGASKQKGMWMGGFAPLGYDALGRQLVINPEEAAIVRRMFALYRTHQNSAVVARTLAAEGVLSKRRPKAKGRGQGGVPYTNGALFNILRNPLYCGKVRHKDVHYLGQHEAIISEAEWNEAQAIRESRRARAVERKQGKNLLLGLLIDHEGRRYRPTHTTKGGRRYRYYVSVAPSAARTDAPNQPTVRLPADELEQHVRDRVRSFLTSSAEILDTLTVSSDPPRIRKRIVDQAAKFADGLSAADCRRLIDVVRIRPESIDVVVHRSALCDALGESEPAERTDPIMLSIPARLYKTGHDLRLVFNDDRGVAITSRRDLALIQKIARGRVWYEELTTGRMPSIVAIAEREGLDDSQVARILYGALLAPNIIERILSGTQPVSLTADVLNVSPPIDWSEQRRRIGTLTT